MASFRGKKDKRRERSRDRKERSTSRKRSRKDEDRIKNKAKPMKVIKAHTSGSLTKYFVLILADVETTDQSQMKLSHY